MVKFKNEYGSILETNNELLIGQYKKKYTEINDNNKKKYTEINDNNKKKKEADK